MGGYTATQLGDLWTPTEEFDRVLCKRLGLDPLQGPTPSDRANIWQRCAADEEYFAFNFVRTKDEARDGRASLREFREEPYIREIFRAIRDGREERKPVLLPKSRRMRVTWTIATHLVWKTKFHRNRLCLFQSRVEKDSWEAIYYRNWENSKCSFIEAHLPPWLRSRRAEGTCGNIFYPTGSKIRGIAQGKHTHRGVTASTLALDECAFWDTFEDSYEAALALVQDGTEVIALTSASAGSKYAYYIGEADEDDLFEDPVLEDEPFA